MNWNLDIPNFVQGINQPRSFYLTEFSPNSVRALSLRVNEAIQMEQVIFPIHIESMGGDIASLKAMLSILTSARSKGLQIATITAGEAASAGAFMFCFGNEGLRFMGDHAHIMVHGIQVSSIPDGRASEQKELFNELMKEEQELLQVISAHLKGGRNKDWIKKELHKRKDMDWYMNAKDALDLGLTNHIGLPTFSLKLIPEISVNL
jgi:ATP-dependent protease ClpP protease subunit